VPFGGYVRFPENYDRTRAFEREDAAREARDAARLLRVEESSRLEKTLELLAANSFLFNVATLGWLKQWQARREEEQLRRAAEEAESAAGSTSKNSLLTALLPWVAKGKRGEERRDKEERLALLEAGKTPDIDYFDDPDLLQNRPWPQRAIVLSGGVAFNLLLALACYFGELTVGRGLPSPVFEAGAVVSQMPGQDSPSFGVLRQGDVILGVNDYLFASTSSSSGEAKDSTTNGGLWASQREISNAISTIRETPDGKNVKLTILHGSKSSGGSGKEDVVSITPRRNAEGVASIGVQLGPNYLRTDTVKAANLGDAATKAGAAVYDLTSETARSIVGLLVAMLSGKGLPAGTAMSGPIGVIKSGAEVVKTSDVAAVAAFAASISINLAVVNALPLPALDGGQLAFVLAEAATGRRIDQRVEEGINAGALLVLLIFSIGTAVGDVTSLFR